MYASQIARALSSNPQTRESFLGVFPSDKLPREIELYPASVVANTDPAHKPGTHWIAFYFDEKGHLDYFDSYGHPPTTYPTLCEFAANNSKTLSYNNHQIQGMDTDVCGHYCIAFIGMRSKGHSLKDVIDKYYSLHVPGLYDKAVRKEIESKYNVKQSDNKGLGRIRKKSVFEQCCCCCTASAKKK